MATLPFEPDISNQASKSGTPRTLRVEFGDGYNQRADDGINNSGEKWNVGWDGLVMTDANTLEAFLKSHGAESFDWTPPGESQQYFIVLSWNATPIGDQGKRMTAIFERVYDLA